MGRRRRRRNPDTCTIGDNNSTTTIAIIGAGLCGLASALALQQRQQQESSSSNNNNNNIAITIYERDADNQKTREEKNGYGLTLTYHPNGILHKLGILHDILLEDCPSRSHYLFHSSGLILGYFGNAFFDNKNNRGCKQRGNCRVPRSVVRQILLDKVQTSSNSTTTKVHWNHKLVGMEELHSNGGGIQLTFDNGRSVPADVVIAADGIRSTVTKLWIPDAPPPQSLHIRIVLGLTNDMTDVLATMQQPQQTLLQECGFYTLHNAGRRLFVMPYTGSALGRALHADTPVRYMWQLSFVVDDHNHDDKDCWNSYTPLELQQHAVQLTQSWHPPVPTLIQNTPVSSIWGTLLHDQCHPERILQQLLAKQQQRVLIAGDALHAMSPFKGQGANQSLQDGWTIAKWLLTKQQQHTRIANCMRELVQRSGPVVSSSRQAANHWHTPQAWQPHETTMVHPFAGASWNDSTTTTVAQILQKHGITATTLQLDASIRQVLRAEGRLLSSSSSNVPSVISYDQFPATLQACHDNDLAALRSLSFMHPSGFLRAVQDMVTKETCLDIACANENLVMIHWLITDCGCGSEPQEQQEECFEDHTITTTASTASTTNANNNDDDDATHSPPNTEKHWSPKVEALLQRLLPMNAQNKATQENDKVIDVKK